MGIVVVWWLWMEAIGLAALPLAFRFFRRLPDRGYAFARPLGLLLTSYVLWLGCSLGFLRNSLGGALFSLAVVAVGSGVVYWRGRANGDAAAVATGDEGLWRWLRANGRVVLCVELLFAAALGLWALVRAFSPEITTVGGEKFMEIMYLNSIGRSAQFPPHDAWLSGYGISYYYFGYVMMAILTRLSGMAAHMTFNVGEALLFALTCTGAFGIVYNLVKKAEEARGTVGRRVAPLAFGFLGTVLVAVMGNLEGFLEVLYGARLLPSAFWRWLDIVNINLPFNPAVAPSLLPARDGWWWWRASRVINDLNPLGKPMGIEPIDEFPGFSFLLGDMHPHVLALPFVLLALAVALRALFEGDAGREGAVGDNGRGWKGWLAPVRRLSLLVPLCLGALGFLNTWDLLIYWLVFVVAYGLSALPAGNPGRRWSWPLLRDVGVTGGAVAILGVLFYLPFYVGFQSQAGGLLPTLYVGTRFRQYFVMFGPFLVAIGGLLASLAVRRWKEGLKRQLLGRWVRWTAVFVLVPLGAMLVLVLGMMLLPGGREFLEEIRRIPFVYQIVGEAAWPVVVGRLLLVKLRTWVMPLAVALMAGLGAAVVDIGLHPHPRPFPLRDGPGTGVSLGGRGKDTPSPQGGESRGEGGSALQFALLCGVVGLLLTLSVEFVYLVDVFQVRMNTVFKFYFQAWVLMAIASAFAVYWLGRRTGRGWKVVLAGFWLLFAMGMVYPLLGNASRAGNFQHAPTLDGTAYLASSQPDDYAAIAWLNEQVAGAPTLLEAPGSGGSSYVYEGRVSALTGLPTLVGWAGHEGQWRGSYDIQSARDPDIQTIYNTLDPQAAVALLKKYDVRYVYVGPLERSKYETRGLAKFEGFMDVVYRNGGVTIYGVRK